VEVRSVNETDSRGEYKRLTNVCERASRLVCVGCTDAEHAGISLAGSVVYNVLTSNEVNFLREGSDHTFRGRIQCDSVFANWFTSRSLIFGWS
jgi:tRNA(His) 5'-end guanylyltransferase